MSKKLRKPPPPLYPLAMRVPGDDFHLTVEQFAALEKAGNVTLSEKQQTQLDTLADFWIGDLRTRSGSAEGSAMWNEGDRNPVLPLGTERKGCCAPTANAR